MYSPSVQEWVFYLQADRDNYSNTPEAERAKWNPITRPWEKPVERPQLNKQTRSTLRAHAARMTGRTPIE